MNLAKINLKEYDAINEFLPSNGFLGAYMKFTNGLEVCPRFRFFSAACVLGAAINNKVRLQVGDEGLLTPLMPNLWVMLLGPPYRGHKNTAINMAVNIYFKAYGDDARILADKLTPESLVNALAIPKSDAERIFIGQRDSTGLIKVPEMSVLFGKQQYNTGMIALITDLNEFREEWVVETIGRGMQKLKNLCISVITGSTPKWLATMIPQDAFTGGFMRRFIIVELPSTFHKRVAEPRKPSGASLDDVITKFRDFKSLTGKFTWTDEGRDYYKHYYENFKPTGDEQYDSYHEAQCEQALKLAMILDLNNLSMELTKESLERSRSIIESISPETVQRIQSLTSNPRMNVVDEIKTIIQAKRLVDESTLLKLVYRNLQYGERQFYEAIAILKKTGAIIPIGKPPNYSYMLKKDAK